MSYNSNNGPDKGTGQFHSVKGNVNETIGNVTGQKDWQRDGQAEHRRGEAEYDAARAKGFVEGVGDRISGKKDAVLGALKGDKSQQIQGNVQHDKGQAQQDINNDH
ncbi:hypothetical protein PILCRDRAFT_57452 [Piloderma croceum F 1598]|uniref:CsbD-like domain-containing protein n=1 Tax=Piloderma croceum (strain F 1598) TaxID=765440 RepID=A0A0C3GN42_PILCF|nr:hypothetical protein PILCRDRAFT_57452 [Piloderma croceum F 1598]